eukprot:CAMPEP_0171726112 /NCGR_PEP_ID=MMETSP0991-20121206/25422_1 /TAXON_ID=483369 /ORGANISM="non described non described, Strain CCMP2098" /LENGTH=47 /DNA_ID= /DNA_START= /DNA_END= /DNA_ORIENTATION=
MAVSYSGAKEHQEGLVDLGFQRAGGLEEVQQIQVIHLEEHARDLAGE